MATINMADLEFCPDCVQMIANGEGTDAHSEAMIELWGEGINGVLGLTLNCPEDCDGYFTWRSCNGCGDTLGGDRHPGVHIIS